jgi:hypothetical protein
MSSTQASSAAISRHSKTPGDEPVEPPSGTDKQRHPDD